MTKILINEFKLKMKTKTFLWIVALFIFFFATIGFVLPFMLSAANDWLVVGGLFVIILDVFVALKVVFYCITKFKKRNEKK